MVVVEYAWVDNDCQPGLSLPARHRPHGPHPRAVPALPTPSRPTGRRPAIQISHAGRQRFILEQPKAASDVPWPEITAMGCPIPIPHDHRRDPGDRQGLRPGGQAGPDGRLRHGGDPRLPRLPHLQLPLALLQQAHRLVRRARSRTASACCWRSSRRSRPRWVPTIPVVCRLSGTDYEPDGYGIEETVELCQAPGGPGSGRHPHVGRHPPHHHPRSQPHGHVAGPQRLGGRGGQEGGAASR